MTRAWRLKSLNGLDDFNMCDEPDPVPQRGEVLIRVRAVSLNYRDLAIALGTYVWPATPGLIPCSDAVGEIAAVGEGVTAFKVGDRVASSFYPRWFGGKPPADTASLSYGSGQDGWLCSHKVVSQEAVVRLPDALDWAAGSTLPCAGVTAFNALCGGAGLQPGDTVLTLGSGGVSIFALQLAKAFGARVIATTSSDDKAEILRRLGADEIVNYRAVPEWGQHVRKVVTGGLGADRVVEVGGPGTINQSLYAVARGGELVLVGYVTQDNPGIDYFHLKGTGATIRSINVGPRAMLEQCIRVVTAARISPVIDRQFAFEEAREAFVHLRNATHVGKIVIMGPEA